MPQAVPAVCVVKNSEGGEAVGAGLRTVVVDDSTRVPIRWNPRLCCFGQTSMQ